MKKILLIASVGLLLNANIFAGDLHNAAKEYFKYNNKIQEDMENFKAVVDETEDINRGHTPIEMLAPSDGGNAIASIGILYLFKKGAKIPKDFLDEFNPIRALAIALAIAVYPKEATRIPMQVLLKLKNDYLNVADFLGQKMELKDLTMDNTGDMIYMNKLYISKLLDDYKKGMDLDIK